jgi:hypothetical protein
MRTAEKIFPWKRTALGLIALIFVFVAIICYPQIYYFSDKIEYKNFRVYCDVKMPDQIYPILDDVDRLIRQSDCATNTSYTHLGHTRTLSNVLAHELMHVLIENKWLLKSKSEFLNKNSLTKFGLLWKEEGYAEYVAGGSSLSLDDGLKMLNNEVAIECVPQLEYFKYWLAVRHLILEKHMTFEQILYAQLDLYDVLREAKQELEIKF